jgi:hypothetical protein
LSPIVVLNLLPHFWRSLHETMGTDLTYSTTYHPQTTGQTKRVNQILEEMGHLLAIRRVFLQQ